MIRNTLLLLSITFGAAAVSAAQKATSETLGSCTLKDHVYTCDSAAFSKELSAAKSAAVETQNVDAYAREQLKKMISAQYGKQAVEQSASPDLIFLIIPAGADGIYTSPA